MFSDVMVPLDGSELGCRALPPAAQLARRLDATLTLLTVVTPRGPSASREELEALAAELDAPRTGVEVRFGVPIAEIIAATAAPERLVCMSTRGRGAVVHALLGSVASGVVREVGRPVMLVGPEVEPEAPREFGSVLVPYDGSKTAEAVVPAVTGLASALRMHVDLVQVVPPMAEAPTAEQRAAPEYGDPDSELAAFEQRLTDAGLDCERHVIPDERPAEAIARFAGEQATDVVALASHGRTGATELLMGSVASGLVRSSPAPVLMVRAGGQGAMP